MHYAVIKFLLQFSDIGLRIWLSTIVLSLCFLVYFVFQKITPKYLFGEDSEYAGYIYNAMGVVFSLIFAFITVLVWQNYNNVSDATFKEASKLNNIYRLLSALPPEIDRAEKAALIDYTQSVITDEWPLLSKNQFSIPTYEKFLKIENDIVRFQPKKAGQANAHLVLLQTVTEYLELRRSRIYSARFALDPPAGIGLISSSLVFLLFSCLFKMNSGRTHLVLIGFLGLTIVGVLYFLLLYIHPFLGPIAISPEPFEQLLKFTWNH